MSTPTTTRRGRPEFVPSDAQKHAVRLHVVCGVPQKKIAEILGIDVKTLRKHFWVELNHGADQVEVRLAAALYAAATNPTKPYYPAAMFLLKTKFAWRESDAVDVGKKQAVEALARTAEVGTKWEELLVPANPTQNLQ